MKDEVTVEYHYKEDYNIRVCHDTDWKYGMSGTTLITINPINDDEQRSSSCFLVVLRLVVVEGIFSKLTRS